MATQGGDMQDEGGQSKVWGGGVRGAFHAHSGWYFNRDSEGQVLIQHREGTERSWHADASVILDAGMWASIVASVSAEGETSVTFRAAEALHGGGTA